MVRPVQKMPNPSGIGSGQTATLSLPLGLTYHAIMIRLGAKLGTVSHDPYPYSSMQSFLNEVRLVVDGEVTYQCSVADLMKINAYYGHSGTAGVLPIFLSRPWMRTPSGEDQTAYGTAGGISNFTLEIEQTVISSSNAIERLEVYAVQSAGTPWGPHLRMQRHHHSQGITGPAEISDLPRGDFALAAMHFGSASIDDVEVRVNNRSVIETDKAIRSHMAAVSGRTIQPGMTHIDLMADNRLVEALPMNVQDFRVQAEFSAAGNVPIYTESIRGAST